MATHNISIEEIRPAIINLSYQVLPPEDHPSSGWFYTAEASKTRQFLIALAYSPGYERCKDEYVTGTVEGHTMIVHHLIARKADQPL